MRKRFNNNKPNGGGNGRKPQQSRKPQQPKNEKGGGPKILGQSLSFWQDCFKCAACHQVCSGEIALAQHCQGKAHAKKAGFSGFAGLIPNDAGIVPQISEICIAACGTGSKEPKKTKQSENLASVGLTDLAANVMIGALRKTDSMRSMNSMNSLTSVDSLDKDNAGGVSEVVEQNSKKIFRKRNNNTPDLRPPPALTSTHHHHQRANSFRGGEGGVGGNNGDKWDNVFTQRNKGNVKSGGRGRGRGDERSGSATSDESSPADVDPMGPMGEQRRGLPVFSYREQLLSTISDNHVTVVEGETGSGKTTQVGRHLNANL